MKISVRPAERDDWPEVLRIQRRAIHEIAAADYSIEMLNAWGGAPITDQYITKMLIEFDTKFEHGHIVIVAEVNGDLAGFGEIVPKTNELLAVYVNPDFERRGVGSAILWELERLAKKVKLTHLKMNASLTAAPFYKTHGFKSLGRDVHNLRSGDQITCVKMRKDMT